MPASLLFLGVDVMDQDEHGARRFFEESTNAGSSGVADGVTAPAHVNHDLNPLWVPVGAEGMVPQFGFAPRRVDDGACSGGPAE